MSRFQLPRVTRLLVASLLAFSVGIAIWAGHVLDPDDTQATVADSALTENESSITEMCWEPSGETSRSASTQSVPRAAGMRVYRDPKTGKFGVPPPSSAARRRAPTLQQALSRSHEGLEEVYNDGPGGGVFVDLRGRFLAPVVARKGPDGKVSVECLHGLPEAHERE